MPILSCIKFEPKLIPQVFAGLPVDLALTKEAIRRKYATVYTSSCRTTAHQHARRVREIKNLIVETVLASGSSYIKNLSRLALTKVGSYIIGEEALSTRRHAAWLHLHMPTTD